MRTTNLINMVYNLSINYKVKKVNSKRAANIEDAVSFLVYEEGKL